MMRPGPSWCRSKVGRRPGRGDQFEPKPSPGSGISIRLDSVPLSVSRLLSSCPHSWLPSPLRRLPFLLLLGGLVVGSMATEVRDDSSSDAPKLLSVSAAGVQEPTSPVEALRREPRTRLRHGAAMLGRGFYVDPDSTAATAARSDGRFAGLASVPQAIWLTEHTAPVARATEVVRGYTEAARTADQTLVLALYAIPGRDCGSYSGGGLTERSYLRWVRRVAAGLEGRRTMVVLEPDAVASLGDCPLQGQRARLLRGAVAQLSAAGAWVYLDAGHSRWQPADTIADRLLRAGIRRARGFALNVSNHNSEEAERSFARAVGRALAGRGVHGRRFVIDTSRNGAGASPGGEWCNSPDARVGAEPGAAAGRWFDARLWVKHPGESDGECHGGPSAGQWWPDGALRLMGGSS